MASTRRGSVNSAKDNKKPSGGKTIKRTDVGITQNLNKRQLSVCEIEHRNAKNSRVNETSDNSVNIQSNVPVSNGFGLLNPDVVDNHETIAVAPTTVPRPPPIVVRNYRMRDLQAFLQDKCYQYKNTSQGIKIYCDTEVTYKRAIERLRTHNVQYYTHDFQQVKPLKCVLRGMCDTWSVDDIHADLEAQGFPPMKVHLMERKNSKSVHKDEKYLVLFDSKNFTLKKVMEVRSILNVIVSWHRYTRPRGRATFCHRCLTHGHGTRNCNVAPKCKKCSDCHLTDDCMKRIEDLPISTLQTASGSSNQSTVVQYCANCKILGHLPHHSSCAYTVKYINAQKSAREKSQPQRRTRTTPAGPNLRDNQSFPNIEQRKQPHSTPLRTTVPPPSFESTVPPPSPESSRPRRGRHSYANTTREPTDHQQQDSGNFHFSDYSIEFYSDLFSKIFDELPKCKSKKEVGVLMVKISLEFNKNRP